jgi:hypothetical protein
MRMVFMFLTFIESIRLFFHSNKFFILFGKQQIKMTISLIILYKQKIYIIIEL